LFAGGLLHHVEAHGLARSAAFESMRVHSGRRRASALAGLWIYVLAAYAAVCCLAYNSPLLSRNFFPPSVFKRMEVNRVVCSLKRFGEEAVKEGCAAIRVENIGPMAE
jgi:hypothetical protein